MITIGLMSGTSMDGIDGVVASWRDQGAALPELRASAHRAFPTALRNELLALQRAGNDDLNRSAHAANGVAAEYAELVSTLLKQAGLQPAQVLAAGAHGVTVRHAPVASGHGQPGISIQLLNAALLAERSGVSVVHDVRSRDIAAGGQGAPLVPAFHAQIFGEPGKTQVVLNLGGIANITILHGDGRVEGFDTGPGNCLLDLWAQRHRGSTFDDSGRFAASGTPIPSLLERLLRERYFQAPPPKSTGRDLFNAVWLESHLGGSQAYEAADVQATLTALTAQTVAEAIRRHAPEVAGVWVCGGGAKNRALMADLQSRVGLPMQPVSVRGVDEQHVEALAWAWFARAHVLRLPGNVPAVTGAAGPRVLGSFTPA
jgi:anhydro-N-acetylmuramic acid kinase